MQRVPVTNTDVARAAAFEVRSVLRPYKAAIKRSEKPSPPPAQPAPRRLPQLDVINFLQFLGLHLSRSISNPHKRHGTAARRYRGRGGLIKRGFRVKDQIHAQIQRAGAVVA